MLGYHRFGGLPGVDVGFGDDWLAGDGVRPVFLGREEGDVVAKARRIYHHQVGAGRDFLDHADAVSGLGVAVELNIPVSICKLRRSVGCRRL